MSNTSKFIAELVCAANNLEKQNDLELNQLVEDTIHVIHHLRRLAGVTAKPNASDPIFELQFISAAITIGWATPTRVKMALLEAAGTIRDLRVILYNKARGISAREDPDSRQN